MRGYYTQWVYMGYIPSINGYIPFSTEEEYKELFAEYEKIGNKRTIEHKQIQRYVNGK